MLPRVLKNFTAYVDGRGHVGRVVEVKLPDLSAKVEAYRGGGMDAEIDLEMGMEKLDVELTMAEMDPELIKLWGLNSASTQVVIRGALQRQGEEAVPVVIRLQGGVKQVGRDPFKSGANSQLKLVANCNRYRESINGEDLVDIDILNMKRIIDGVDQLASQRAALGIN